MLRPWSDKPIGPLMGPWDYFNRDARVVSLFGNIFASTDISTITADSVPFLAEELFGSLMLLAQESNEPVKIAINNSGGSIRAGCTIIQAIEHLQAMKIDVQALVIGSSMSMATSVLAACTKGQRFAVKRSVIHAHSSSSHTPMMKDADKEKVDEYLKRLRDDTYQILAQRTKIPEYFVKTEDVQPSNPNWAENLEKRLELTKKFLLTEQFLTPEQALEAGIIDGILEAGDERLQGIFRIKKGGGS